MGFRAALQRRSLGDGKKNLTRLERPLLQIVSGSRDKTIKLWNTLGECKYTIGEPEGHTEWVSCVRFSPVTANPVIVSAGWDKLVKVCRSALFPPPRHPYTQFLLCRSRVQVIR